MCKRYQRWICLYLLNLLQTFLDRQSFNKQLLALQQNYHFFFTNISPTPALIENSHSTSSETFTSESVSFNLSSEVYAFLSTAFWKIWFCEKYLSLKTNFCWASVFISRFLFKNTQYKNHDNSHDLRPIVIFIIMKPNKKQ